MPFPTRRSICYSDPTQVPIGESTYATPATYREDQFTANIDHAVSQKNELSGRFFYSHAPTVEPFSPNAANVPGWGTNEVDQNAMLVLADTHVLNPSLVNIARFGYMRFSGISAVTNPILASDLGTESPTGVAGSGVEATGITVDGLFTIGDAGTPFQKQTTNSFIWQDTVSLTKGRQSIRTGAEVKRHQVMVNAPFSTSGLLDIRTFDDFLLGQSAAQNGSPNGISNVTMSGGSSGDFRKDERYTDFATFFQDDIKVTPRLTLNAGLRYEIFSPPSEIHGRLVDFDPAVATLAAPRHRHVQRIYGLVELQGASAFRCHTNLQVRPLAHRLTTTSLRAWILLSRSQIALRSFCAAAMASTSIDSPRALPRVC